MRTDGVFIEAGEQDNLIVQKLNEDTSAYGIFGFSYLDQNSDTLQGAVISKTAPTFENIAGNNYYGRYYFWSNSNKRCSS
jgi:phosphate transport system substrate-binding protein